MPNILDNNEQFKSLDAARTGISTNNDTRRSLLHTIIFLLPLLLIYEIGLINGALGEKINGADAIFRTIWNFLTTFIGITAMAIISGAVIIGLLGYVISSMLRRRVGTQLSNVLKTYGEGIGFGLILALLLYIGLSWQLPTLFSFEPNPSVTQQALDSGLTSPLSKIVASVGAGVFEELLFRVVVLNAVFYLVANNPARSITSDQSAFLKAAVVSSFVFAVLHLGSVSPFGLVSIFMAGLALSWIYAYRGLSVAIGTHITYNLLLLFGIVS